MSDWGYNPAVERFVGSDAGAGKATPTGGAANTKGSWVQLFASAPFNATGLMLQVQCSTGDRAALVDIGIGGAGSEVVILPNIYLWASTASAYSGLLSAYLPVQIPAGTRVAVRLQSSAASGDFYFKTQLFDAGGLYTPQLATAYGADTATSHGTVLTSGSGSKGSWAQLSASVAGLRRGLICIGKPSAGADFWIDIGVGGAGSEVIAVPDLMAANTSTTSSVLVSIPLSIPPATRLAARTQASSGTPTINVSVVGIN